MEPALFLRALSKTSVCLMMLDTNAVVHAELKTPLTPRSSVGAQLVNALNPVRSMVQLGPYDMEQHRFTQCMVDIRLPEPVYARLDYLRKKNS
jgi:hypothetical protein